MSNYENGIEGLRCNHVTRDIKEWGACPKCDDVHKSNYIMKLKRENKELRLEMVDYKRVHGDFLINNGE